MSLPEQRVVGGGRFVICNENDELKSMVQINVGLLHTVDSCTENRRASGTYLNNMVRVGTLYLDQTFRPRDTRRFCSIMRA